MSADLPKSIQMVLILYKDEYLLYLVIVVMVVFIQLCMVYGAASAAPFTHVAIYTYMHHIS